MKNASTLSFLTSGLAFGAGAFKLYQNDLKTAVTLLFVAFGLYVVSQLLESK